eukprot:365509-Chlamydomonas_euryale.AAC.34
MATTRWLVSCQAVCQQLGLPSLPFQATDFGQLLKDAIAVPDLRLAAAAVTCVATSVMLLIRLLAGGSTASTPSNPLDPLNSDI